MKFYIKFNWDFFFSFFFYFFFYFNAGIFSRMKICNFKMIMPQVDFVTFNNQIFWGLIVFFFLYNFLTSQILEKIAILHYVRLQLINILMTWRVHLRNVFFIFINLTDTRYWTSLFILYKQYNLVLFFVYTEYLRLLNVPTVHLFTISLFNLQTKTIKQSLIFSV